MRFFALSLAAVVGLGLLGPVSTAHATCMTQCTAKLIFEDCTYPADPTVWPLGSKLTVTGNCETCCSPPGGPLTCSPEAMTADTLTLSSADQPVAGVFSDLGATCGGPDHLFRFDASLAAGSYDLLAPYAGTIVLQFSVAEAGCTDDADCSNCAVCIDGECKGTGLIICQTDGDCDAGEICKVNAEAPCANQCVSAEAGCATFEDCPPCHGCMDGQCVASGLVLCANDGDCDAGEKCLVNEAEPCKNECVPAGPECVTDADCGNCTVCVGGECKGLGLPPCTTDADCGDGKVCEVNEAAPCASQCVPANPECTTHADCPVCSGCVAGECMPSGLVECTEDSHCGADERCAIDEDASCKNVCEPLPDGPDAGGSGADAGGSGADAGESDSGEADAAAIGDDAGAEPDASGSGDSGDTGSANGGAAEKSDSGCSAARTQAAGPLSLALALALLLVVTRRRSGVRAAR